MRKSHRVLSRVGLFERLSEAEAVQTDAISETAS